MNEFFFNLNLNLGIPIVCEFKQTSRNITGENFFCRNSKTNQKWKKRNSPDYDDDGGHRTNIRNW